MNQGSVGDQDSLRAEILRLLTTGLTHVPSQGAQVSVNADNQAGLQAVVLLDSYVSKRIEDVAEEVIYRAFSNTRISQLLEDVNNSSALSFKVLESKIENLSGLKMQVTTGLVTAAIITVIILILRHAGLPIDIPSKGS